mmetsp:Transcript_11908/g.11900  ORF Transcript_11908/g.11900 Transcript_11908/m.11900 type:complete len:196 (-) Transcript_11908:47-634(-)
MFTTKTTLETEESSQNQYEIESTSTFNGKEQKESLLNLSNISSDGIINEERFCSPINAGRSSVPALNFPRGRNAVASLNSSWISSTNVSAVDSKLDKRLNEAPSLNSTLNSILNSTYKGSGLIPNHYKNRLSHGKVSINKLTKGVNKPAESCSKTPCAKSNRKDSQDSGGSWKSKKPSGDGFKQTHWNFTKNQRA